MKKNSVISVIIAVAMIALGFALVLFSHSRGENALSFFKSGVDFSVGGGSIGFGADQKGYTVCLSGEERFDPAEVKSLDLDWISGSVSVEPWDGDAVLVREKADKPLTEGQRLRWKLSGGELSVLFCADGETRVPDKALTVLVPRGMGLKAIDADAVSAPVTLLEQTVSGAIDADTTSGAVTLRGCACRSLDVDTVSGAVSVEATAVSGAIDLDSTSGKLALAAVSCASFDADTVSARVEAEALAVGMDLDIDSTSGAVTLRALAVGGEVDAGTMSGRVELRFESLPASVNVDTGSGAVTLAFPKGTALDLDYDSASGRLSGAFSSVRGGLPVDVSTVSGNLTIEEDQC